MRSPTHATEQIATAVGWVAIESAEVEVVAARLAAAMVGTPRALLVLVGQGWAALSNALEALIKERIDFAEADDAGRAEVELLERTRATVRHANDLMVTRGHVVHAVWEMPYNGRLGAVALKRWRKSHRGDWTPEQLGELREQLRAVATELDEHFEREAARSD